MLLLTSTSDLLTVVTASAVTVDVHADWMDYDAAQPEADRVTPGRTNTAITTATTTTVVAAPGSGVKRNVKTLNIRNKHASSSNNVNVRHTDGTTTVELFAYTLLAGEEIQFADGVRWMVVDATGSIKYSNIASLASQADVESATSTTVAVTPGRMHYHPGVAKFVCMTTGTTAPVMQTPPSYNMTSITDAGVGRLTVTIATDFSSANWCCQVTCVGISTTLTAIALVQTAYVRFATVAAGTIEVNCRDAAATTNVLADPSGYMVVGYGDHA